jgi:hypothetical protein
LLQLVKNFPWGDILGVLRGDFFGDIAKNNWCNLANCALVFNPLAATCFAKDAARAMSS